MHIAGTTVKTAFGDYVCANLEEAEALLTALRLRQKERQARQRTGTRREPFNESADRPPYPSPAGRGPSGSEMQVRAR